MTTGSSNSGRTICLLIMVPFISISCLSYQSDTILPGQSINSKRTIISRGGIFELGFFPSYDYAGFFCLGIRYKSIPNSVLVWTPNTYCDLNSSDINGANLILTREGNLQLQVNGEIYWITDTTTTDLNTTKAVLLDSGNFIIGSDGSPNIWESFNYPSDTWLPGAKIGLDASTGKKDPTILTNGYYSLGIDPGGSRELLIRDFDNTIRARIGASDFLDMNLASKISITFNVSKTNGVNYATYRPLNDSTLIRIQLYMNRGLRLYIWVWDEKSLDWKSVWTMPYVCGGEAPCGSNGICSMNQNPVCSCPKGFEPKHKSYLELHDYSGGCVRRNGSQCLKDKDEFLALHNIYMPLNYEINSTGGAEPEFCRLACAANCSCSAYSDSSGCYLWYGDLLGMEQLSDTTAGKILVYLRSSSLPKKVSLSYQFDVILPGQSIYYYQTITSQGGIYELGFYHDCYVGIWYKNDPSTVVWIANRHTPIVSSDIVHANLTLTREGDLQLQFNGTIIWHTNTSTTDLNTIKAILLDNGNLIVGSDSSPNMWESFDYPIDTWLPGAKIGLDVTTGKIDPIILTAWNGVHDSTSEDYSFGIDQDRLLIWNKTNTIWRSGASNFLETNPKTKLSITFNVSRTNGVNYAMYHTLDNSTLIRMVLHSNGQLRLHIWDEENAHWLNVWARPNVCDNGVTCGSNGICSMNQSPICSCPKGFHPNYISYLEFYGYFAGCARKHKSQCLKEKDEFVALDNIKWPQNNQSLSIESVDCRIACARHCNCSAYSDTSGCYVWYGDLLDMEQLHEQVGGETIFLRLGPKKGAKKAWRIPLALSTTLLILILGFLSYYVYRKKIIKGIKDTGEDLLLFDLEMTNKRHLSQVPNDNDLNQGNRELALPIFSLSSIYSATNNFSSSNKLGEGGFGLVYKGKLHNGKEVAVKRLSKHSGQGLDELINEAKLIAKLKHTNLVRLLGCCIQKDEKILIYEYMPNKSLDFFLFDSMKKKMLDWSRRVHIIEGVAQGLLYLHHYSRLRIIHRDLKASNILLDADMKPKISDFGMAKIFRGNQLQANTKRIVGTYGYMPPEYALEGLFSIKTDVFSFGVLLLEILSGERNANHEDYLNLLGYAWKLWRNDTPLELLDPILKTSCNLSTALRYIHVGLLCVQEHPDDRPSILDIIAMVRDETKAIEVQPTQPAYLARRRALEVQPEKFSSNELTYSMMQPR